MTIDPDDDQFLVERTLLRKQTGHRLIGSSAMAIGILSIIVIGALVVGRAGTNGEDLGSSGVPLGSASMTPGASPRPTRTTRPNSTPAILDPGQSSAGSARPEVTPKSSSTTRPALANVPLDGAPEIALFQRVGEDIKVLGWRPGEPGLATRQTVRGATAGLVESQSVSAQVSPDGTALLVTASPATNGDPHTFRVFRLEGASGREIWRYAEVGDGLGAGFSPTGQIIIGTSGPLWDGRGWTIVDTSTDKPIVHLVDRPPLPPRDPSKSGDYSTYVFNYVPLALSANGDWLYVMSTYATEPIYRPAYRISIATGRAQPIDALPVTGVARIISPAIEPVSGRLLLAGPYTTANNPGSVAAWSAGAQAPDFRVDLGVVFAAMWADDGRIITAAYTRVPGPFTFRVMSLSATGEIDDTYITAEADNAALVGVLNGFAAAYVTWNGSGERDLIVIRLADGAISRVQAAEPEGLMFAVGLRP